MVKISVIVPVYGVEEYIYKCIDSLVNQTFKDFEILVINDGTKDKSIDIIKEKFHDKRIRIYDKENGGLSDARNYALQYANGEYIMYVDSDDYVSCDILKKMYDKAKADDSDIVVCMSYQDESGNITHLEEAINTDLDNVRRYMLNRPSAWCKLIKKEILNHEELKFIKGHVYEDVATMPSLSLYTNKISFLDEYLYYYLVREGSITHHKEYKKNMEDIFYAMDNLYSIFKKNDPKNTYHDEIEYIHINHLLHSLCLYFLPYEEGIINIKKVSAIMKERFPNWNKNKYYKKRDLKYRIICELFYHKQIMLAKIALRKFLSQYK